MGKSLSHVVGDLREGERAQVAGEGPFSRVPPHVPLQVAQLDELLPAVAAAVRPLLSVVASVDLGSPGEGVTSHKLWVRIYCHVILSVSNNINIVEHTEFEH